MLQTTLHYNKIKSSHNQSPVKHKQYYKTYIDISQHSVTTPYINQHTQPQQSPNKKHKSNPTQSTTPISYKPHTIKQINQCNIHQQCDQSYAQPLISLHKSTIIDLTQHHYTYHCTAKQQTVNIVNNKLITVSTQHRKSSAPTQIVQNQSSCGTATDIKQQQTTTNQSTTQRDVQYDNSNNATDVPPCSICKSTDTKSIALCCQSTKQLCVLQQQLEQHYNKCIQLHQLNTHTQDTCDWQIIYDFARENANKCDNNNCKQVRIQLNSDINIVQLTLKQCKKNSIVKQ